MINIIIIITSILTFLLLTFLLFFYFFLKKRKKKAKIYTSTPPKSSQYEFFNFENNKQINSQDWIQLANEISSHLQAAKVDHLIFVHGTFVGSDPFHIIRYLKQTAPNIIKDDLFLSLEKLTRNGQNKIIKDLGNFDQEYISLLKKELSNDLNISDFTWSGANHHLARLEGTIHLIKYLYDNIDFTKKNRFLLIGHSHAGQLFAILSKFIISYNQNKDLKEVTEALGVHKKEFQTYINKLKNQYIDFVTLGTPPRYSFETNSRVRVLHITNHRGQSPFAGNLKGLLFTKDGDYIQQLGIQGSDTLSPIKKDRELNRKLDQALGDGVNLLAWKENIKYKKRVHDSGMNYLVNYNDQGMAPNCLKTLFGHGVYTSKACMLYNLDLICKYYYKK